VTSKHAGERELPSYGRRRGRRRSSRQAELWGEALPGVALAVDQGFLGDLQGSFEQAVSEVWLEIGFGGGEHLIWQSRRHPDVGLIGCETYEDGVVKVLGALETERQTNVKLWAADARNLIKRLPGPCLSRVFILFPDPWPKKRHHKRRLVAPRTLDELSRVMRSGAELRVATDIGAYATAILLAATHHPSFRWSASAPVDWRERPPDWPPTRYETKARTAGRRCYYFRFERI
jgi:tRNA (guanine-N7-)-methyltransferase